MAVSFFATNPKVPLPSTELFTSDTSQTILLSKSLSLSPKPNTRIDLSSNDKKDKFYYGIIADSWKWRTRASFFQGLLTKANDVKSLKKELLKAIEPLDRGAEATGADQELVDKIARKLEAVNQIREPLKSNLLNGKWELIYTTSQSVLKTKIMLIGLLRPNGKLSAAAAWDSLRARTQKTDKYKLKPWFLRPNGNIYQAINADSLRAQNMETWPFFNQITANLVPLNARRVAVKFDFFRIGGLIPIKSPGSGRGQLEITYLDEELRLSRGDKGNLFILKMVDPSYRVPL